MNEWRGGVPLEAHDFDGQTVVSALARAKLEPDQRVRDVLRRAMGYHVYPNPPSNEVTTLSLLFALVDVNARGTEWIDLSKLHRPVRLVRNRWSQEPGTAVANPGSAKLLASAARLSNFGTLGASHVLAAMLTDALESHSWARRTPAASQLIDAFGLRSNVRLQDHPRLQRFLEAVRDEALGADDYQYMLTMDGDRVAFRIVSRLGDYYEDAGTGSWVPERALLTHLGGIGTFLPAVIGELEDLLGSGSARELDYQRFFERHPYFLRQGDYREVYPHVYLTREDGGRLIPDFILTNKATQQAAVLDLKLPGHPILVRDTDNRVRFSQAVMKARAQLLEYQRWFDDSRNRERLQSAIGLVAYRPRLMVVVGRASEFTNEFERQLLRDQNPDLEVVTYDDLVALARQRMARIEPI